MRPWLVTLTTTQHKRLRASILAANAAEACITGRRCALAEGYQPTGMTARPMKRTAS
jgi:hypothetical protein